MKLTARLLFCLSAAMLLVLSGCSDKERLEAVQKDRDEMTQIVSDSIGDISEALDKVKQENQELGVSIEVQSRQLAELEHQIRSLREQVGVVEARIAQEESAAAAGSGWRWLKYLLVIIIVIVIVFVLWRLLKPRPFEEEDDEDFSSFDDDFGFDEDDDFEDELGDEAEEISKEEDEDKKS